MTPFNAIKISGIGASRPPRVRKAPCVDLFYKLPRDAPDDWSEAFNGFGRHVNPMIMIDAARRDTNTTYVNDVRAIPVHFEQLNQAVAEYNTEYPGKLGQKAREMARDNDQLQKPGGAQYKLNEIIASLDFDA